LRNEKSLGDTNCDDNLKTALTTDYPKADISDLNKAILGYVEKLTLKPSSITQNDINKLKSEGCTERMIHDIVQVTSYFNYINRLADGLGVELEDGYN
jgi:uncharacterized peroxidase-related enzyme